MNNDGRLDLVVGSGTSSQIRVLTANGDGTFEQQAVQAAGGRSWQLMLGDVNGDGNLDVSSANARENVGAILLGNGDGTLQSATTYDVRNMGTGNNSFPLATDLGDLDGDGDLDWITSSFGGEWIIMTNDGSGEFEFYAELDAPTAASCSLMHDFDNDGDLDLGLVDELANVLILSRNDGDHVLDGDFNADGNVDLQDIDTLTSEIGHGGTRPLFDLNGDGSVDAMDVDAWLIAAGQANLPQGGRYLWGDGNLDGVVDLSDYNLWNSNKFDDVGEWSRGNYFIDGSGTVDVSDFNVWSSNKFRTSSHPIPEPPGFAILCLLLLLLQRGQAPTGRI